MTDTEDPRIHTEEIHDSAQQAVEQEQEVDIREKVRDITLNALTQRKLDAESIKAVVGAVAEGSRIGAVSHGERMGEALKEAISGLDDALTKAAEATKLAIEEAAGRAGDFSQQELKRSISDLGELEKIFLDTLTDIAKNGTDRAAEILGDLATHARNSGTAVGEQVVTALADLQRFVQQTGKAGLEAGVETARTTGAQIVQIASGILAGIADSLQPPEKTKPGDK